MQMCAQIRGLRFTFGVCNLMENGFRGEPRDDFFFFRVTTGGGVKAAGFWGGRGGGNVSCEASSCVYVKCVKSGLDSDGVYLSVQVL